MKNKVLYGAIAVLALVVVLQAGYLIGKMSTEVVEKETIITKTASPAAAYTGKALSRAASSVKQAAPSIAAVPAVPVSEEEIVDFDAEMAKIQRSMSKVFSHAIDRALSDENLNNLFGIAAAFDPAIDIKETDEAYIVVLDIPGVEKETLDIDVKPNYLTVSGERTVESEEEDKSAGVYKAERRFGTFTKTIPLSNRVIPEEVEAESSEGVLMITLPKEIPAGAEKEPGLKVPVK